MYAVLSDYSVSWAKEIMTAVAKAVGCFITYAAASIAAIVCRILISVQFQVISNNNGSKNMLFKADHLIEV